jgi:Tol biopolymer transport system component
MKSSGGEPIVNPSLSPDGRRVAFQRTVLGNEDVWIFEFEGKHLIRLTSDPHSDSFPHWSPDSRQIVFSAERNGLAQIFRMEPGGSDQAEQLTEGPNPKASSDWSSDGKYLLYVEQHPQNGTDLWVLPLEQPANSRKPTLFRGTQFNERSGQFSPDGKWIAYTSDVTGQDEVYISAFPPSGVERQVSNEGGRNPRWRRDGKELFYRGGGQIMAANIRVSTATIESDTPRQLFPVRPVGRFSLNFNVTADGQRFFLLQPPDVPDYDARAYTVVSDWQATLKQ